MGTVGKITSNGAKRSRRQVCSDIMLTYQVLVYNSKQLAIHYKACKVLDVAQQVEELKNKQVRTHNFEKKFRTDFLLNFKMIKAFTEKKKQD